MCEAAGPDRARRTAGTIRPGIARHSQCAFGSCAVCHGLMDRVARCRRAAPHALAMIAVAGKGVDAAKFGFRFGEGHHHRVENAGKAPGALL